MPVAIPAAATPLLLNAPTDEARDDLNSRLAPATVRAAHFDALWSAWSQNGDYVAATAAGLAAVACRAAVERIHAAWFAIRQTTLELESMDRPFVSTGALVDLREDETNEKALNRLVADLERTDENTLASIDRTLRTLGDRSLSERVRRIRACSEWTNPRGILHDHPPAACEALFHALLVSPPTFMEVRDELEKIVELRREAITFRDKIEAHERELREIADSKHEQVPRRFTLSGLTPEQSEHFHDLLDAICAGDVRARHGTKSSERKWTIRLIAEHFRSFLNLSRAEAAERFRVAPWSTGIAALAHAALFYKVSTEDVRGALQDWPSD